MEFCTTELFSNAPAKVSPDDTLSSFKSFLLEQLNLVGHWEVAILKISHPSTYQTVTDGKFMFCVARPSNSSGYVRLGPGVQTTLTEMVEAISTLIQEKHNHTKGSIAVEMSGRSRNVVFLLTNESASLAFF